MAGQFEREVRLDRNAQLHRAAGIVVPAAVGRLVLDEVVGELADTLVPFPAEESEQEDVFRFEDSVALEFADPVAVRFLAGQQLPPRASRTRSHCQQMRLVCNVTVELAVHFRHGGGRCSSHGSPSTLQGTPYQANSALIYLFSPNRCKSKGER